MLKYRSDRQSLPSPASTTCPPINQKGLGTSLNGRVLSSISRRRDSPANRSLNPVISTDRYLRPTQAVVCVSTYRVCDYQLGGCFL